MQKGFTTFMKTERGFTPMVRLRSPQVLIVIIVAVLAVGGYFVYTSLRGGSETSDVAISPSPTPQPSPSPSDETVYTEATRSANWKTYTHSNFTFKYPDNWYPENNPNYPGGNNVSFFLVGTKADHGYGDHKGNEIFSFEFSEDDRSLEELKREYYQNAVELMVGGKPAIKTSFNLLIVKPSQNKNLNIAGGIEAAKSYLDQILSTFRFE